MYGLSGISQKALDLMVREEAGDQNWYHKHYEHFDWPEGSSGPTVGIGCDLGYMTPHEVKTNWSDIVSNDTLLHLVAACGLQGEAAHRWVNANGYCITVTWEQALEEFTRRELPHWVELIKISLVNTVRLSPDSLGALVSLAYNRGAGFHLPGARYYEMRLIAEHMATFKFDRISFDIMAMQRLWPYGGDLWHRREHEAQLFADGLKI